MADGRIRPATHWIYLGDCGRCSHLTLDNAVAVQRLVESVPADYASVGGEPKDGDDVTCRYLMPAVRNYPDRWQGIRPDFAYTIAIGLSPRRAAVGSMIEYAQSDYGAGCCD